MARKNDNSVLVIEWVGGRREEEKGGRESVHVPPEVMHFECVKIHSHNS